MRVCTKCEAIMLPKYNECQACGSDKLKPVDYKRGKSTVNITELKDVYGTRRTTSSN